MNWLKHILVVIALLLGALPCAHAEEHAAHSHEAASGAQFCSSPICGCHICDEAACSEELGVDSISVSVSVAVDSPPADIILFVFTETRPVIQRPVSPVCSALSALKTVHLLI